MLTVTLFRVSLGSALWEHQSKEYGNGWGCHGGGKLFACLFIQARLGFLWKSFPHLDTVLIGIDSNIITLSLFSTWRGFIWNCRKTSPYNKLNTTLSLCTNASAPTFNQVVGNAANSLSSMYAGFYLCSRA